MPEEMAVRCDLASTTMLLWLGEATQVFADPHNWDGGQPPQLPPQPSSPHVLLAQSGLQFGGAPESAPVFEELVDALELAFVDELLDAPLADDEPRTAEL